MQDGIFRFRLDTEARAVLTELLREASKSETSLSRQWLMERLADQFEDPRPGRPRVLNMKTMSETHYRTDSPARRAIAEVRKIGKCEHCGLTNPDILEVDHVDCNRENNDRENLRLLCPNCHKLKALERRKEAARILGVPINSVMAW